MLSSEVEEWLDIYIISWNAEDHYNNHYFVVDGWKEEFIKSFGKHNTLDGHEKGWFFPMAKEENDDAWVFFVLSRFRDWIQLLVFIDHFTWSKLDCLWAWFQARWLCRYIDKNFHILSVHDAHTMQRKNKEMHRKTKLLCLCIVLRRRM